MAQKWANNAFSTLGGAIDNLDTSITVATDTGDRFPAVSGDDFFNVTLANAGGDVEIVKVISRAIGSDEMTIVRGQEATVPLSWAIGDIVELRPTAASFENLSADIDDVATDVGNLQTTVSELDFNADAIGFDDDTVSFEADNVQDAIGQLDSDVQTTIQTTIPNTVQSAVDELLTVPQTTKSSGYTLVADDTGRHVAISSGDITVPAGVFSAGDIVVIYNNSSNTRDVIPASGVTMYWVDGDTGTRTLLQRALASILCVGSNTFVITGQGVS